MKKVMILTASTGGGHNKASNNIKDALAKLSIDSIVVDSFKDIGKTGKLLDYVVNESYGKTLKYVPIFYDKAYELSDTEMSRDSMDYNPIIAYMESHILKKIEEEGVTDVICTHPFPAIAVSNLKGDGKLDIPLFSVITDYTVHQYHMAENIDRYLVAHEDVQILLEINGVPKEKIYPVGIPIELKDYSEEEISKWRKSMNIPDKFTVLLAGGSLGSDDVADVYKRLIDLKLDINVVVICGKNEKMKEDLEIYNKGFNISNGIIIGFTEEMDKFYQVADVMITKPGGLTITECMKKKLPMIVPFFIPGQEEANRDFLVNNRLILCPTRYYPLEAIMLKIIEDKEVLASIGRNMERNRKLHSADKIAAMFVE